MINFAKPDSVTGNRSTDVDYEFFRSRGMMTVESQQRNASQLDKRQAELHNNSWFKISGALTGD